MRNLKRNSLGTVLLALLMAAVFAPGLVQAQNHTVGVKAGDWVKYGQITVNWIGNGTAPSVVTDEMKMDWRRIDVLSVAGTTATLNETLHYTNGTQTFLSLDVNVQIRNGIGSALLIASNLTAGDQLIPETPGTINQTMTRMYAGASRTVNMVNSTSSLGEIRICWDQKAGIMVETYMNLTLSAYSGGYIEESWKATETNLQSANALDLIQNNLIYIIAGMVAIIVIMAAVIVLRRRKPPPLQQTPTPSTPTPSP